MKRSIILIAAIASFASYSHAMPVIDPKCIPALSLPDAYILAVNALGPVASSLHCTAASLQRSMSAQGEWLFTFYSSKGEATHVYVPQNKSIKPKVLNYILDIG